MWRAATIILVAALLCVSFVSVISLDGQRDYTPDGDQRAHCLVAYMLNSPAVSPKRVYVDQEVTFFVNASSTISGATLNITIYFDYLLANGSVNPESARFVTQAPAPAYITTTYAYDHVGNLTDTTYTTYFQARVLVDDGSPTSATASLKVYVVGNTAPILLSRPPSTFPVVYEYPYKEVSYVVQDFDTELVTVTWDFGDGTEPAVNETIATPAGTYVMQNHTWVIVLSPGRDWRNPLDPYYVLFDMSVKFEDSYGHVVYSNHTVNITPPLNYEPVRTFTSQSDYWSPGFELPIYASATDAEGDPITWTFLFQDSEGEEYLTEVYHTDYTEPGTTVWRNTTHTYPVIGTYYITLWVSDALEPYQAFNNLSQTIQITIIENRAPGVLANISMSPVSPRINTTLGYAEVFFSIQANDFDGDVLYITWDFGDGETASNESIGGMIDVQKFNQSHRYTVAREYNVSVLVDDNRGHTVLRYKVFNVLTTNAAPVLTAVDFEMSHGVFAAPGTTVNITLILFDFERDPLTVWVDFGDNSTIAVLVLTEFCENGTVTVKLPHVYNSTGKYNVTIAYTDYVFGPGHNASFTLSLEVKVPRVIVIRVWDWWDYTSLGLVFLGVALIFARWYFMGKFRKELDSKGLSLEEYKTIIAELKSDRNTALSNVDSQVKEKKLDPVRAGEMRAEIKSGYVKKVRELRAGTLMGTMGGG